MTSPSETAGRTGRPPGRPRSTATPEAILRAARALFTEHGFSSTSVRDIAAMAGSDPAVVIRKFGSKEKLFLEVVNLPPHFGNLVEGPLDTLGREILRRLIETDDSILRLYKTLLSALDRPEVRRYLNESTNQNIVEPLSERLTGPDAQLRAQLVAAQIAGLLMSISISDAVPPMASTPDGFGYYAKAIQSLIDPPSATADSEPG